MSDSLKEYTDSDLFEVLRSRGWRVRTTSDRKAVFEPREDLSKADEFITRMVQEHGARMNSGPKTKRLLTSLLERFDKHVSTDKLEHDLYWDEPDINRASFRVQMRVLRKSLVPTPYAIETKWGQGYRLYDTRQMVHKAFEQARGK